ncbi:hypothetical protein D9758_014323 [Tetrapyrgos nigripes]|uniref:C2H2-type domain-containing protein n=1 Tax=Tetrapyrgos nigripes TaxID=182062 RepID=A0A8H5FIF5_9AGAR|nr:hypothetical protein D9758_014323 [Tetrapyrgos nigripes]
MTGFGEIEGNQWRNDEDQVDKVDVQLSLPFASSSKLGAVKNVSDRCSRKSQRSSLGPRGNRCVDVFGHPSSQISPAMQNEGEPEQYNDIDPRKEMALHQIANLGAYGPSGSYLCLYKRPLPTNPLATPTPSSPNRPSPIKLVTLPFQSSSAFAPHQCHAIAVSKERYPCDHCDKTYSQSGGLERHLRKHTGEKLRCPYDDCDFENADDSIICHHKKTIHGYKPPRRQKAPQKAEILESRADIAEIENTQVKKKAAKKSTNLSSDGSAAGGSLSSASSSQASSSRPSSSQPSSSRASSSSVVSASSSGGLGSFAQLNISVPRASPSPVAQSFSPSANAPSSSESPLVDHMSISALRRRWPDLPYYAPPPTPPSASPPPSFANVDMFGSSGVISRAIETSWQPLPTPYRSPSPPLAGHSSGSWSSSTQSSVVPDYPMPVEEAMPAQVPSRDVEMTDSYQADTCESEHRCDCDQCRLCGCDECRGYQGGNSTNDGHSATSVQSYNEICPDPNCAECNHYGYRSESTQASMSTVTVGYSRGGSGMRQRTFQLGALLPSIHDIEGVSEHLPRRNDRLLAPPYYYPPEREDLPRSY